MRFSSLAAACSVLLTAQAASACEPLPAECLPRVVAFPAYTPEGAPIGVVEAEVRWPRVLQTSASTGQPITVIYNNPGRYPGAVDPGFDLVPLPHVARSRTQGSYPVGY